MRGLPRLDRGHRAAASPLLKDPLSSRADSKCRRRLHDKVHTLRSVAPSQQPALHLVPNVVFTKRLQQLNADGCGLVQGAKASLRSLVQFC